MTVMDILISTDHVCPQDGGLASINNVSNSNGVNRGESHRTKMIAYQLEISSQ